MPRAREYATHTQRSAKSSVPTSVLFTKQQGKMSCLSRSCRARAPIGLLLFATAASLLNVVLAGTISVSPGGLQSALDNASPGDTIELEKGEYWETVVTKTDGRADAYITIKGDNDAVLKGDKSNDNDGRIFNIEHSYYQLDGFKMDGRHSSNNYIDKCLYVQQSRDNENLAEEIEFNGHKLRSSINGLVLSNLEITNCGGECVRMRYFITYAQVYGNTITNCGVHDFVLDGNSKNGEGIYLGTSSNQWDDGKNPSNEPDVSCYNHFFGNHFDTQGNEGIDIKEGSQFNIVEDNYCTGQLDPNSACLDARGDANIFRYNTCVKNLGAGVRIGGHKIGDHQYGVNNEVYANILHDNEYAGIKITHEPQRAVCGNEIAESDVDIQGSSFAESLQPTLSCDVAQDIARDISRLDKDGSGEEEDCDCEEVKTLKEKLNKAKKSCREGRKSGEVDYDGDSDSMDEHEDEDYDDDYYYDDDDSYDSYEADQDGGVEECSNGLPGYESADVCCPLSCGRCGGSGCSDLGEGCCTSDVKETEIKCSESMSAPCIIDTDTVFASKCSNGLPGFEASEVCCPISCGECGGSGCSDRGEGCCTSDVKKTETMCSESGSAPCIIDDASSSDRSNSSDSSDETERELEQNGVDDDQRCSNGLPGFEAADVCCPTSCGACGGSGCSDRGEGCCTSDVKDTEVKCSESGSAPCIIDTDFVESEESSFADSSEEEEEESSQEEEEESSQEEEEESSEEEEEESSQEEEEESSQEEEEEESSEEEEEEIELTVSPGEHTTPEREYPEKEEFEPPTI